MTVYTYSQLEGLWVSNGGNPTVAPMAAAIAEAESSGDSAAVNPNGGATGLWQIHPGGSQYLNATTNAQAAVAKYNAAGGFSPWTTYTNGEYKAFMQSGVPATLVSGAPATSTNETPTQPAGSDDCLIHLSLPGSGLPLIGGALSACVFTKSEARALLGGLLMGAGAFTAGVGVLSIAAGLGHSQSKHTLTRLGATPIMSAGRKVQQGASSRPDADDRLYERYQANPEKEATKARGRKAMAGTSVKAEELAALPMLA